MTFYVQTACLQTSSASRSTSIDRMAVERRPNNWSGRLDSLTNKTTHETHNMTTKLQTCELTYFFNSQTYYGMCMAFAMEKDAAKLETHPLDDCCCQEC
jgi:hypothetical protein